MESVRAAKKRLKKYPGYLATCSTEGALYAKCVTTHMSGVTKDQCRPEFEAFKKCVASAAKKAGSRYSESWIE